MAVKHEDKIKMDKNIKQDLDALKEILRIASLLSEDELTDEFAVVCAERIIQQVNEILRRHDA